MAHLRPRFGRLPVAALALVAAVALVALMVAAIAAIAAPTLPALSGRVVDGAGLLSAADKAQLEADLAAFEAKSTDQIVVVTVPSLQGYAIEEFAVALGRAWKIGQAGKDNGLILLVAPNERKVRFEVGRGLEPLLPDGKAGTIIRQTILPTFRRGDFPGGIKAGVAAARAVLEGDAAELEQRSKRPPPPVDYSGYIFLALWLAIFAFVIYAQYRAARQMREMPAQFDRHGRPIGPRRQRRRDDPWPNVIVIPGGSGGWGGGWGSGSGGGGFSGGGGSFGGGGASGDW
jgi:uncharacterized protein